MSGGAIALGRHTVAARSDSSQVRHPWRATLRTGIAAFVAALIAFPGIAVVLSIDDIPAVASVVGIAVMVTRVMAIPAVDDWLDTFAPWLASTGPNDDPNRPTEGAEQ